MAKFFAWLFRTFRDKDLDGVDGENIRMSKEGLIYGVGPLARRTRQDVMEGHCTWLGCVVEHASGRLVLDLGTVTENAGTLRAGDYVEVRAFR